MRLTATGRILLILGLSLGSTACDQCARKEAPVAPTPSSAPASPTTAKTDVEIQNDVPGTGSEVASGKNVAILYKGSLTDGKVFDQNQSREKPFTFKAGAGQVIAGMDKGLAGMRVGGKRRIVIPAAQGYGASGVGGLIPPDATLIFDVELLKVED